MKKIIISFLLLITGCQASTIATTNDLTDIENHETPSIANNLTDLENYKNRTAIINGILEEFEPWETGKGAEHMFWDYQLELEDGTTIPAITENTDLDLSAFKDTAVTIRGEIFYGIIIGDEEGQNMTGFRIDINEITSRQ